VPARPCRSSLAVAGRSSFDRDCAGERAAIDLKSEGLDPRSSEWSQRHGPTRRYAPSLEPDTGINPNFTTPRNIYVEELRVREAPYPWKKPRTLREEPLAVGALDVDHPKVERASLRVA